MVLRATALGGDGGGKQGLREWKDAVHIFLSEDEQTAFQRALEIGRLGEDIHTEDRREVETRLAEIVRLDCLGSDRTQFEVRLGSSKAAERLPFEHVFNRRSICLNRPSKTAGLRQPRRPVLALAPVALRAPSAKANTERQITCLQVGPIQTIKRSQVKLTKPTFDPTQLIVPG